MTDPTTKTVRGWLVELVQAVSAGANAELLAEIRYLNQGLFGSTAQLPATNPPTALWSNTFYTSRVNWANGQLQEGIPLARLLVGDGNGEFGYSVGASTADSLSQLVYLVNEAIGRANNQTLAATAFDIFNVLEDVRAALGGAAPARSNVELLAAILAALGELGQNGGPLTAREYLAGILVQTTRQADCCEEGPPPAGTAPAWNPDLCPEHSLLTATFTFTGEITAAGALPVGVGLNSLPPNFTSDPGDGLTGPLLRYTGGSIGTCWYVAVDPAYTGTVGFSINGYNVPGYGTDTGRPNPPDANPGPTVFTMLSTAAAPSEAAIAYGGGLAIGPGDPPLLGSQVVVYVGRPDPELGS